MARKPGSNDKSTDIDASLQLLDVHFPEQQASPFHKNTVGKPAPAVFAPHPRRAPTARHLRPGAGNRNAACRPVWSSTLLLLGPQWSNVRGSQGDNMATKGCRSRKTVENALGVANSPHQHADNGRTSCLPERDGLEWQYRPHRQSTRQQAIAVSDRAP